MEGKESNRLEFTGYYPGVVGRITELHAVYYHENWGFDVSFETQVGSELSQFMARFVPARDVLWVARVDGLFAGAVAIDGSGADDEGARLRWFIVSPEFQGLGIGAALIRKAMQFCRDAGYRKVFLWTFEGLAPARHLYEREGFQLTEQHPVRQWGTIIEEQKFEIHI